MYSPAAYRDPREVDPAASSPPSGETPAQQNLAPAAAANELAAAQRERDPEKRATKVRSALQAWARIAPDAAAHWVLAQPAQERLVDASVVLIALADRPDDAVRIGRRFCDGDSAHILEHGHSLLTVLNAAGEFERAVNFASLGGPERSEWVAHTFTSWAELAPAGAARAALTFEGDDAVAIVFNAWAAHNPAAAARYTSGASDLSAAQRAAVTALAQGSLR